MKILTITPNLYSDFDAKKIGMAAFYLETVGFQTLCGQTMQILALDPEKNTVGETTEGVAISRFTVPGRKWGSLWGEKFDSIPGLEFLMPTLCRLLWMRRFTKGALASWEATFKKTGFKPDLVYAHTWYSGLAAAVIARSLGVPWVLRIHGAEDIRAQGRKKYLKLKCLDRVWAFGKNPDRIFCCDDTSFPGWLFEKLGASEKKVHWFLDPLDRSRFTPGEQHFPQPNEPFTLMTLSRVTPIKRIHLAVEAVRLARQKTGRDLRLVVVGGGGELDRCKAEAQKLEGGTWCSFPGFVPKDQLPAFLQKGHLLLSPYQTASLSNQVWEAMANGVPTLSVFQEDEVHSFMKEGENGFLLQEETAGPLAEALAGRIAGIVADKAAWERVRTNGIKTIEEQFPALEKQLQKKLEVFRELVGGKKEPSPHV